ncbi:hypothetical protein POM88_045046 [Heracleum sosnowskyi]|uniref:Plastocyanin-like domain-containing protein n=1 Tax=Heracleum sosnowskyi TaxID=360622 RepID=A0AAD8M5U8_9APIA|nr:hypothetical protein POM88_045046 [Heracleum sosnowskyi]
MFKYDSLKAVGGSRATTLIIQLRSTRLHHRDERLNRMFQTPHAHKGVLVPRRQTGRSQFWYRHTNPRIILLALRAIGNYVRWGTHDQIQALRRTLNGGKDLGMPDGVLINEKGPYRYNDSLVPDGIDYLTINVHPGKTYRLRVSNVGISTSLNFRIQGRNLLLAEDGREAYSVVKEKHQHIL